MKPIDRALADAARQLEPSSDTPRLDSELLMAEALHIDRDRLILSPPDRQVPKRFWDMLERRKEGEPVAYITGRRAFWNIELHVGPGVLVPRPDSEVLIASAIEHFEGTRRSEAHPRPRHGARNPASRGARRVAGGDRSRRRRLAPALCPTRLPTPGASGLKRGLKFLQGNWAEGLVEKFDLILCNPPYIAEDAELGPGVREFEPDEALFAGAKGLDAYRALAPQLPRMLDQGGLAAVEIGSDQAGAVTALLARDGLHVRIAQDLAGRDRARSC